MSLEDNLCYERNTLQRALGVDLTYEIIKLNYDDGLIDRVEVLAQLMRHWHVLQNAVQTDLAAQELPLDRIRKSGPQSLLALIAMVSDVTDEKGIRRDAEVALSDLEDFVKLCCRNQTTLEELLGQRIRKDIQTNPVRQLNAFLKLGGLKLEPVKRQKREKKSVRRYGFVQDRYDLMMSLANAYRSPDDLKRDLEEKFG
jgi:hypothetical protein